MMKYILFPNFYVDAFLHGLSIFWFSFKVSLKMDWLTFRYAYHNRLHKRFDEFGR